MERLVERFLSPLEYDDECFTRVSFMVDLHDLLFVLRVEIPIEFRFSFSLFPFFFFFSIDFDRPLQISIGVAKSIDRRDRV